MENTYSISDLSNISGVSIQNIRIWEKRHKTFDPSRTKTNRRYYTDVDYEKIILIKFLIDNGHRIGKIGHFTLSELRDKSRKMLLKINENSEERSTIIMQLLQGDLRLFNDYLMRCLTDISPIEFVKESLIPIIGFLEILDHINESNNGNKLLALSIIQKQLIIASEQKQQHSNQNMNMLVLRADIKNIPVSLYLVHFLATAKKYKSDIFLNFFNEKTFEILNRKLKPDIVYTEFTEDQSFENVTEYLNSLERAFKMSKILVSGQTMLKYWKIIPNKVYYVQNLDVLSKAI
ncbi:MAG: MerR family transcriptional regulator [Bacteroidales bacterium]|nr:MerR family transcriptional regulator [Bacteroidales bacterium]